MDERDAPAANSPAVPRFERADWIAVAVLVAISLAIRVPFRSRFAYHWDSAQFALAIQHFDVSLSLPHLPGYFLYVMLGRLVNLIVGEPHASLVWMSVVAGAALAGLGYLLATALWGRDCGLVTGCLLASSPLCWFQSEVALTTIIDSAIVTAAALVCWRAIGRGGGWPWVFTMAVMFAFDAGVRPQTSPALFVLWLYTFSKFPRGRRRRVLVGLLLVALFCAAWFVPMVQLSGGLGRYLRLYPPRMRMNASLTPWSGGTEALSVDVAFIVCSCWIGLLGAGLLGGLEVMLRVVRRTDARASYVRYHDQLWLLAVWIVPMVALGFAAFTTMPGYVLNYFPAVAILAGFAVTRLVGRIAPVGHQYRLVLGLAIACITMINSAVFLLPPQYTQALRAGLPLNTAHIREHDQQLARWFQAIRQTYRPDEVVICHYGQSFLWGFRHFQYYLPEYENVLLTPDRALPPPLDKALWCATNRSVEFISKFEPRGRRKLLLVVPPGGSVELFAKAFDVTSARKWNISEGAPLYILTTTAK